MCRGRAGRPSRRWSTRSDPPPCSLVRRREEAAFSFTDHGSNFRRGPPTPQARKSSKVYDNFSTPLPLIIQILQFLWISKDLWKFGEILRNFHENRYEKRRIWTKKMQILQKNYEKIEKILTRFCKISWIWSGAKECRSCRSRKMLKNAPTLVIRGVDTEENEPSKVSMK